MNHLTLLILLTLSDGLNFSEKFYFYKDIYKHIDRKSHPSVRVILNRLVDEGKVVKIVKNTWTAFRLSPIGTELLRSRLGLIKVPNDWDGVWRVLIIEKKRLAELGRYGLVGYVSSVYLSIRPITEKSLLSLGVIFESRKIFGLDNKGLANKLWNLGEINKQILDWIAKAKVARRDNINELLIQYPKLISQIPNLPEELLPKGWAGKRAENILRRIVGRLGR